MPNFPDILTIDNLKLSPSGELCLKMLSKDQRKALYDLCTILNLTMYDPNMRVATEALRDIIRLNTLDRQHNLCDFDLTKEEKILAANPIRKRKHD